MSTMPKGVPQGVPDTTVYSQGVVRDALDGLIERVCLV